MDAYNDAAWGGDEEDVEEQGEAEGRAAGLALAVQDGYKLGALSGDVAWEEVGAYSAWAELVLLLQPEGSHSSRAGHRSATAVADAAAAFPRTNADARVRQVEVGADLQRMRARSKTMLAAAGLALPGSTSAHRGVGGQEEGLQDGGGAGGDRQRTAAQAAQAAAVQF